MVQLKLVAVINRSLSTHLNFVGQSVAVMDQEKKLKVKATLDGRCLGYLTSIRFRSVQRDYCWMMHHEFRPCLVPKKFLKKCYSYHIEFCDTCMEH